MNSGTEIEFSVLEDDTYGARQKLVKRQRVKISLISLVVIFVVVLISLVAYYESKPQRFSDELSSKSSRLKSTGDAEISKSSVPHKYSTSTLLLTRTRRTSSKPEVTTRTTLLLPDSFRTHAIKTIRASTTDSAIVVTYSYKTTLDTVTNQENHPRLPKFQLNDFSGEDGEIYNIFSEKSGKSIEKIKVYRHFIAYKTYDRSSPQRFRFRPVNGSSNLYAILSHDNYYLTYENNDHYKMAVFEQSTSEKSHWIVEQDEAKKAFVIKPASFSNLCLIDSIAANLNNVLNDIAPCDEHSAEKRWIFVKVC